MARRRRTPEQIIRALAEGQKLLAGGATVAEVCRTLEIAESTWARWLNQSGRRKMVTPNRRRDAVAALADRFGVSQRHACRVVGQHRSTQWLGRPVPDDQEVVLRTWLRQFAVDRPRWGWRRAHTELRKAGWRVNHKRVRRLWRDEGLQVPVRRKKARLAGIATHVGANCPIAPDAIWAADLQFDRTIDGRQIKMLNIIDEFTREALAIEVAHNIGANDVVIVLDFLALTRQAPAFVRFDNGPEFAAHAVADWCRQVGTDTIFIDPGSPWQNAWIESFNSRFRDEFLNGWQFDSLLEAQVLTADWRTDYNTRRPHSALDNLTPTEFHQAWTNRFSPQPQPA